MKHFERQRTASSKVATQHVINLVDSDDEAAQIPADRQLQQQATDDLPCRGDAAGAKRRKAAAAASERLAEMAHTAEYEGEYEFEEYEFEEIKGDGGDEDSAFTLPDSQQRNSSQTASQQSNGKLTAQCHGSSAPALQQQKQVTKPSKGKHARGDSSMQPPAAKRSRSTAAKKTADINKSAAGKKQTTLKSKGFGSLCFSMSQPSTASAGPGATQLSQEAPPSQPSSQPARSVSPQLPPPAEDVQWIDRYEPQTPDDLIVHKRKVSEVQGWLQSYLENKAARPSKALLITGPSGCGKSVTVRVLAAAMGFEVLEWDAPVPTLWADYQYQAGAGVHYTSKLDEFDMFVTRCKFAALPLACLSKPSVQQPSQQHQASSQQQHSQPQQQQVRRQAGSKLLLVEDLPYVGEASRRARLVTALQDLATTARCPVVVVSTTEEGSSSNSSSRAGGGYGERGSGGPTSKGLHKDILAVLERIGAEQINFNAITVNNIVKVLHTIAGKEGFTLSQDVADGIAEAAAGDLRNAIQNLQLMQLQQQGAAAQGKTKATAKAKGRTAKRPRRVMPKDAEAFAAAEAAKQKVAEQLSRDQHLSVFHAAGKILHYKRSHASDGAQSAVPSAQQQQQAAGIAASQEDAQAALQAEGNPSSSRFWRPPLQLKPEAIIQESGLEPLQVTAFLAENYLHFYATNAMDETASAACYLSDAGFLACYRNTTAGSASFWDEADTTALSVQAAASSSVAARGVLFSNMKPAPSRWLPLRGSSCFQPEKAATGNLQKLGEAVQQLQVGWSASGQAQQQAVMQLAGQLLHSGRQGKASQVLPYLQVLCKHQTRAWIHNLLPRSWYYIWGGQVTERQSSAMQDPQTAALQAAVAAVVAAAGSDTGQLSVQQQGTYEDAVDEIEDSE